MKKLGKLYMFLFFFTLTAVPSCPVCLLLLSMIIPDICQNSSPGYSLIGGDIDRQQLNTTLTLSLPSQLLTKMCIFQSLYTQGFLQTVLSMN